MGLCTSSSSSHEAALRRHHLPPPTTAQPRIQYLPLAAAPDAFQALLQQLPANAFKNKDAPIHVFGALANNSKQTSPFLQSWVDTKLHSKLSNREQELIILRMAFWLCSQYVWKHHVIIGKEFGIKEKEIGLLKQVNVGLNPVQPISSSGQITPAIIRSADHWRNFSARECAMLTLVDEMMEYKGVHDETWKEFGTQLLEEEVVDVILIVSQYVVFGFVNNVFAVEVEESVKGIEGLWDHN